MFMLEDILEDKREEREKREIKKFEERRLAREFESERLRAQLSNNLNENELKAWNRINNLANVCILSENRTGEVEEGKEINVYKSSDCEVKMKVGVCEGRVRTVAMGAQRVKNPDNVGAGFFELKGDKGVDNPEGLIYLPGKRVRSTIYRLNLIKLYRRKQGLANLVMENSSEGIDSEILYSVKLFMDFGFQGNLRKSLLYFKLPPDRSSYLRMINAKKKERFLPDPGTIVLRQKDVNLITGKPFRIQTCCSSPDVNYFTTRGYRVSFRFRRKRDGAVKPYSARCLVRKSEPIPVPAYQMYEV
ncbi:uncharacterized protein TNCV_1736911 [Trichonephila clavipes]|nr:uncharacterized protein TNCV_1736911 [Trichonephila clavipes]